MRLRLPPFTSQSAAPATLKLLAVLWALLALAAVFVMTLATDEAWVLNGLRSALGPAVPHLSTELIGTSGGPFAVANLVIERLAGSSVSLHRLPSLLCLALSFALVLTTLAGQGMRSVKWLMLAPLMATPGAVEVGTAALGTSTGVLLMTASAMVWTSPRLSPAVRWIAGGLLSGLAAASRFDLVLFGPAVLVASSLRWVTPGQVEVRMDRHAWAFVAIGAGIFLLNQWLVTVPANAVFPDSVVASTGLGGWALNYPKLLNHWSTLSTFAPLSLLAVMAVAAFWFAPSAAPRSSTEIPRLESVLAVAGVALLVAWVLRAPIPHLRYAFPALFCFSALGAIGLGHLAARALSDGNLRHWQLCHCIGIACLVGSVGTTMRSLVMSDSDYASWEWSNEIPYDYFRRFEARQHQAEIANYLRHELPADARLYSYFPYILRYLVERPVVALDAVPSADGAAQHPRRYLVLTPAVGTFFYLSPEVADWLRTNAKLTKEIGRYSVYQLPPGGDNDLAILRPSRTNYIHHPDSKPWSGR